MLDNLRIVHIMRCLSDSYLSTKSEQITIDSPLTVEHLLPQNWLDKWPLPDGSKGLTYQELWEKDQRGEQTDPRVVTTRRRNALLQTFGNLTILVQPLNSAVSNDAWEAKKPQLLQSSLLPINQQLISYATWDEEAIVQRSNELYERAKSIWPRPLNEIHASPN